MVKTGALWSFPVSHLRWIRDVASHVSPNVKVPYEGVSFVKVAIVKYPQLKVAIVKYPQFDRLRQDFALDFFTFFFLFLQKYMVLKKFAKLYIWRREGRWQRPIAVPRGGRRRAVL
jgi:hypothetical protein